MLNKQLIAPEVINNIYDGVHKFLIENKFTRAESIAGLLFIVGAQVSKGTADTEKLSEYVYDATGHAALFFKLGETDKQVN